MKTALITTTINIPTVLELYRQHGPDVAFFVAGDEKTPKEAYDFARTVSNCLMYQPGSQKELGYKCSELIGWGCIQRRNIALLEALKWGADIIVSIDDDNIPLGRDYFDSFASVCRSNYFSGYGGGFEAPQYFNGLKVSGLNGWFDVGQLLDPISPHRGFPIQIDSKQWRVDHVVNAKVGVAAGICLGDPDISAVTRIACAPLVHRVSEVLNSGIVVDSKTWTVFNSQNTAFIRELAPAFFMIPRCGRMDDIYASLIMQRVMRPRGLHVHHGKPFVYQQRNEHNLVKDLRGEIDGMDNVVLLAKQLDTIALDPNESMLSHLRVIWKALATGNLFPEKSVEAAFAWLDDCEAVL